MRQDTWEVCAPLEASPEAQVAFGWRGAAPRGTWIAVLALLVGSLSLGCVPSRAEHTRLVRHDVWKLQRMARSKGPDFTSEGGDTSLQLAARYDASVAAKLVLAEGANPNLPDRQGKTPLHLAIAANATAVVSVLLDERADPNVADSIGHTPLHLACERLQPDVVQLLLARGADVHRRDTRGLTPQFVLPESAFRTKPQAVEQVLRLLGAAGGLEGFDDQKPNRPGSYPLRDLVVRNPLEAFELYRALGVQLDPQGAGLALLVQAVDAGNVALARRLLELGVAPRPDTDGLGSALEHCAEAARRSSREVQATCAAMAAVFGRGLSTKDELLTALNRELVVRLEGKLALVKAVRSRNPKRVQALLDRGADPDETDERGWTALLHASYEQQPELVALLIQRGADARHVSQEGVTVHFAAHLGPDSGEPNELDEGMVVRLLARLGVRPDLGQLGPIAARGKTPGPLEPVGRGATQTLWERLLRRGGQVFAAYEELGLEWDRPVGGRSMVVEAIRAGRPDVVLAALRAGVDPDAQGPAIQAALDDCGRFSTPARCRVISVSLDPKGTPKAQRVERLAARWKEQYDAEAAQARALAAEKQRREAQARALAAEKQRREAEAARREAERQRAAWEEENRRRQQAAEAARREADRQRLERLRRMAELERQDALRRQQQQQAARQRAQANDLQRYLNSRDPKIDADRACQARGKSESCGNICCESGFKCCVGMGGARCSPRFHASGNPQACPW